MPTKELPFQERVDDAILCAAFRLARLRQIPLRAGVKDFRATCVEMGEVDDDTIWSLRADRCNVLLVREDAELRQMAMTALAREA